MSILKVIILAIVQGLAELLPVSSSAHVVVAEKLLGLDPSSPQMTLLLVMLHTGTMFAVIAYFWKEWRITYFASQKYLWSFLIRSAWAMFLTFIVGYPIIKIVEHTVLRGLPRGQIEDLFSRLDLVAAALFAAGVIILVAGWNERKMAISTRNANAGRMDEMSLGQARLIGAVQGLCLPFRGFSRSGAKISTGLLLGINRKHAERFSFALAVILTPPVIVRELLRLVNFSRNANLTGASVDLHTSIVFALMGAVFSFLAGLLALRWLSRWLETGKWYLFGIYCVVAAAAVVWLHLIGY
jgi:undecaprenyl-diphosphatase